MNHFDLAQSFIERCRAGRGAGDLAAAFQRSLEILGFRYFACCTHVDPLRPPRGAVLLHSYPPDWACTFSELELHCVDPVFHYASHRLTPFFWDDAAFRACLTPPQREILAEGARFGVAHGYTVPIHPPGAPGAPCASCSVVPDGTAPLNPASYSAVQLMACYIYEAASREANATLASAALPVLSRRERQCLELVAQGKGDWEVSRILGLSERTVHNHIERAKRRLAANTRAQAIIRALVSRQISFGDVIRSHRPGDVTR